MNDISLETIERQIPYYLAEDQKGALADALNDFSQGRGIQYYIDRYHNEAMQGDCWAGLPLINFETGEIKRVKGVVLTNTCDMFSGNSRVTVPRVVFAPLISLPGYLEGLRQDGVAPNSIDDKARAIRNQKVSNIVYFPPTAGLNNEAIILLDDVHSVPASQLNPIEGEKAFTLSMVGFYLFLLKLSVHFCRFHEDVDRSSEMAGTLDS
ncbi:hypothetical protein ACT3TQ_15975 [Halomonas sp. AOP12-C2-37]|uniref:hypothetical protein n=1 Tax=unclassified Halomonas TaxID=2609666 RepID=UPI004033B3BE